MDEYLTDEQQADKARNWLRENGVFIVAGVVLGLGGLFGWQQWNDHQTSVSGEASVVWEQLNSAIDGERYNEATEAMELLLSDYAATPYVDQARLALARMHMERNSPDLALQELREIVRSGKDPEIKRVAELRTAQVLIYQGDYEAALAILGDTDTTAFASLGHDLRGDIFYTQERFEDAAIEYQLALDTDTASAIDRVYVQVKLDDVSGSIAAAEPLVANEITEVILEEEAAVSAAE